VVLAALPQADGQMKNRPAVALRRLPGFGDWLLCGVSTQLRQESGKFGIEAIHATNHRRKEVQDKRVHGSLCSKANQ